MALKQCEKCEEMVDEAKAFCPGCGNAFVAEKPRSNLSDFDAMDHTQQLSQTVYNMMLSDMGLNISKAPDRVENVVEAAKPAATAAAPVEKVVEVVKPVATTVVTPIPTEVKPQPKKKQEMTAKKKWLIAAAVTALLLFFLAVAAAGLVFIYWYRFR